MKKIKTYHIFTFAAILLFFVFFFGMAFKTRQDLIDKYYQAVDYYDAGQYKDAMIIFREMYGWGRDIEISPEEYFQMCLDHLKEVDDESFIICPECNTIIER